MDYIQDYYATKMAKLKPEYRQWVSEVTTGEDYFSGMDLDEAITQAYDMQQFDEYLEEQYWIDTNETQYSGYIILN